MKKYGILAAMILVSSPAFGGILSNTLQSGTYTVDGTNYSFGFAGGNQSGNGTTTYAYYTAAASQSAQAALSGVKVLGVNATSIPSSSVNVKITSNYYVYWTENVANEGLPANLYAKLSVTEITAGQEQMTANTRRASEIAATGTMSITTSGGTGNHLPVPVINPLTVTLNNFTWLPSPSLVNEWMNQSGNSGKQTVTLSPSWTLVNTNIDTGFRTWRTSVTIVSPTTSTSFSGAFINGGVWVVSDFASFGHGIFFDVTS